MKPDATTLHDPDPIRLRKLMAKAGVTMAQAAERCGVSLRTMERYLNRKALERGDWIPYPLQFALEELCRESSGPPPRTRRRGGEAE
jgi:lambda repressor-like predicted transcriptional regulator